MLASVKHLCSAADIPDMSLLQGLDEPCCRRVDVSTGELLVCSLREFLLQGVFTSHSLLIIGRPGLGKTPVCRRLAATIACALQSCQEPYFCQTATIDALRSIAGTLTADVPLILDDYTPSGCGRTTLDHIKHVLTVTQREVLQARYDDISLPPGPRLVPSNALTPADWLSAITVGTWEMSAAERRALDLALITI